MPGVTAKPAASVDTKSYVSYQDAKCGEKFGAGVKKETKVCFSQGGFKPAPKKDLGSLTEGKAHGMVKGSPGKLKELKSFSVGKKKLPAKFQTSDKGLANAYLKSNPGSRAIKGSGDIYALVSKAQSITIKNSGAGVNMMHSIK